MDGEVKKDHKLGLMALVTMIFTTVYGFVNASRGFLLMGYAAIPWYILAALGFFLPYAFMMAEYGSAFKNEKGGIYSWMERSVGPKFAFIGVFMWYASYVFWMVTTSNLIFVPLTTMFAGYDVTTQLVIGSLKYSQVIGIMAILWILLLTFVSTRGLDKISKITSIGGTMVWLLNFILIFGGIVVLIANGRLQFNMEGATIFDYFTKSPNPNYTNFIQLASFLAFAIFAFGGLESVAGLVDKTKEPAKNFPKGILLSSIVIAVGYSVCIFCIGMFADWESVMGGNENIREVTMGNVVYVVMTELGRQLGFAFNLSTTAAGGLGKFFAHFTGLAMFLTYSGAFFALTYSPLKQLIEGTPSKLWPKVLLKEKNGVPYNALWVQAGLVIVFISLNAFGGDGAEAFFQKLVSATNVAMSIPYIFLTIAYYFFRNNQSIEKPFTVYKTKAVWFFAVIIVTIVLGFANFFAIFSPVIVNGIGGLEDTITYISGPIVFTIIALVLYTFYQRREAADIS
jgi:amino acid transporter